MQYMASATEWVYNLVKTAKKDTIGLTPFQFDLCFAVGEPLRMDNDVDANDEDDDSDDEDQGGADEDVFVDYIGDIGAKLEKNELKRTNMKVSKLLIALCAQKFEKRPFLLRTFTDFNEI